ncbi:MAG TPA: branched-chain amino acid ABC transporter substrate-binding protein [Deltaproteobacteria bacterium]|nr:branched-chain amino acid ABC transporter substrate-binding protein [Deltaproteobacteria bacterium]
MKRFHIVFITCVCMLCAGPALAADTIKLGVAGAHSGDLASYGLPTLNAAKLVVGDMNAKGGVLGRKVEILAEDDVCKPEVAANVGSKLVSEKATVVLGHICSGATKAALSTYNEARLVTMSPSATNVDLTKSGEYPNFFRTISPDDAQALLEVNYALNTLKVKKVAVIHDKGDYGKGLAEFARDFLEKRGIKPVLFEGITPGAVDYSAIVQKIKFSGADAVIYGGYHPEAAKIVMGMRKKKMKTLFISDDGVKDDTFIKVAGKYAEGVYATGPIDTSKSPMAVAAIEQHKKAYGAEPGAFYLNAYAAAICLLQGIEKAGSTDYAAVSKALRTNWFDTPLGKISFDERGDAKGIGFAMYRVKNGKYVEVGK